MSFVVLGVIAAGLVAAGLYLGVLGTAAAPVTITEPTPCTTATVRPLDPRRVKVNVYNATGRAGLAAATADRLRARRFAVGDVANDPKRSKVTGSALIRYGRKGSAGAKLVATQVAGATLKADKRTDAVVDLVLGPTFSTLTPVPTAPTQAPRCTPPTKATTTPTRTGAPATRPTTTPR
ncbi:MAG: LytR C-terminal domain-containing protein [Actinomycetota bacterium]